VAATMMMMMMNMKMTMTVTKLNVCWLIGMQHASQRFSSQNNSWIFAEPINLQIRLTLDASYLFPITFFRHMSGLGNVLIFPDSTPWPWPRSLAFPQSQALHLLLGSPRKSTRQLDASLSRLGRGIECWQSIESECCDYDTDTSPHTTKKR